MIPHPSSLKCRVLAVIAKDQQPLWIQIVNHTLGEHRDIRHCGRPDRSGGFPVTRAPSPAVGVASKASTQITFVVIFGLDRVKDHLLVATSAVTAGRPILFMKSSAMTAQPDFHDFV